MGVERESRAFASKVAFWMGCWYFCSLVTLFMNKHYLSAMGGDEYLLGICQMIGTATFGGLKVYFWSRDTINLGDSPSKPNQSFYKDMLLVGIMRGLTVMCGLVSLSHVAVSFTETVKSSAPFFTVIFSRFMLGTYTSWQVNCSLIPVMLGLALCSATELSFDSIGFVAAVLNNVIDCVQNVFSKKLLQTLSPVQLQFYTSAAAAVLQLPVLIYLMYPKLEDGATTHNTLYTWLYIFVDCVFYHLQSVTAYYTMSLLTAVSQSVANTAKRALLIFLSIMWFGNPISLLSGMGMFIVFLGVCLYNHCRINYT